MNFFIGCFLLPIDRIHNLLMPRETLFDLQTLPIINSIFFINVRSELASTKNSSKTVNCNASELYSWVLSPL